MPSTDTSRKVTSNLIWRLMERYGAQGVSLIISIVLARLLDPAVYGTVALATVFITILQVFVDSGLGNALVQKKDADILDFSSVFFFNVAACLVLYVGLFFLAPVIASFYAVPELTAVIRVASLSLILSGVKNVQQAYVSREMIFKKFFFATLGGTVGAAVLGITLAYLGFGVWALILQNLFNLAVDTLILWITVPFRPRFVFSFSRLKTLLSFGWKLTVSSLIEALYNELRQLIIGKQYTTTDLSYYNKGSQFPSLIVTNINASIDSVLLPVMAQEQDDRARVREMTRRAISLSSYIIWPLMMGMFACAEPFVRLVLTEKWLPAVPFMQIFCIVFAFYPIHTSNLNAIKAIGRSDLFLILEILKKVVGVAIILATMWISPLAMALGTLAASVFAQIINAFPNRKLLGYGYLQQLIDISPSLLLSGVMGICVWSLTFLSLPDWLTLALQVPLGAALYIGLSYLFRLSAFKECLAIVKNPKKKPTA